MIEQRKERRQVSERVRRGKRMNKQVRRRELRVNRREWEADG